MKNLFITTNHAYDGTQMHSLHAYLNHRLMGNSIISWVGPCHVSFTHMLDGEDLLEQSAIQGDLMLHFIIEIFEKDLFSAVSLQRIFASICKDVIESEKPGTHLVRQGDDLYFKDQKLSISIASPSPVSTMIHFAMNVVNRGTPVKTAALKDDFSLDPKMIADKVMKRFADEFESIQLACFKVKGIS